MHYLMEPSYESLEVSVMNSEDEGEAEPDDIAGKEQDITVLDVADSPFLDPPNCLEDKVDNTTRLVD